MDERLMQFVGWSVDDRDTGFKLVRHFSSGTSVTTGIRSVGTCHSGAVTTSTADLSAQATQYSRRWSIEERKNYVQLALVSERLR